MHPSRRRGFTLIELLVATAVFVFGFAAVFGMFLSGMRYRKLADDTTRSAALASSVLTEVYLDSWRNGDATPEPSLPSDYDGDGVCQAAPGPAEPLSGMATALFPYTGIPGTMYRLDHTTDIVGDDGSQNPDLARRTTALITEVVALSPGDRVGSFDDLERRLHLVAGDPQFAALTTDAQKAAYFENQLIQRGIALRYRAVVVRQPHWLGH
jgi:prepilin-type N-terminal cleavage/methylation domain-containing protein